MKALVAILGHLPAVMLTGYRPTHRVVGENLVALAATAVACVLVGRAHGALAAIAIWAIGHLLWGLRLKALIARSREPSAGPGR